jgi:hypothetical protein
MKWYMFIITPYCDVRKQFGYMFRLKIRSQFLELYMYTYVYKMKELEHYVL